MTKELEAVGKISLALEKSKGLFEDIFVSEPAPIKPTLREISNAIKSIPLIETALKALEIIKKKKVNFYEIQFAENYEEYVKEFTAINIHSIVERFMLTQQEFDLLKEVLL